MDASKQLSVNETRAARGLAPVSVVWVVRNWLTVAMEAHVVSGWLVFPATASDAHPKGGYLLMPKGLPPVVVAFEDVALVLETTGPVLEVKVTGINVTGDETPRPPRGGYF